MIDLLRQVTDALLNFFNVNQIPALFVLLLLEEAGIPIPIPGDTLILLAGTQAHTKLLRESILVVLVSCSAAIMGSSILFWVMRKGGRPFLLKYGRYIRLSPERVERVERWIAQRGRLAIVLGRLIPGLRIVTTVVAGLSGMAYRDFLVATSIAAVIWSAAYFWLGALFGRSAPFLISYVTGLIDYVPRWLLVLTVLFLVVAGALGGAAWTKKRQTKRQKRRRSRSSKEQPTPPPPPQNHIATSSYGSDNSHLSS
jgi:membrane-associated protein